MGCGRGCGEGGGDGEEEREEEDDASHFDLADATAKYELRLYSREIKKKDVKSNYEYIVYRSIGCDPQVNLGSDQIRWEE